MNIFKGVAESFNAKEFIGIFILINYTYSYNAKEYIDILIIVIYT